jgi:hypothetical protein
VHLQDRIDGFQPFAGFSRVGILDFRDFEHYFPPDTVRAPRRPASGNDLPDLP